MMDSNSPELDWIYFGPGERDRSWTRTTQLAGRQSMQMGFVRRPPELIYDNSGLRNRLKYWRGSVWANVNYVIRLNGRPGATSGN